jgi:hypothetical protein
VTVLRQSSKLFVSWRYAVVFCQDWVLEYPISTPKNTTLLNDYLTVFIFHQATDIMTIERAGISDSGKGG